MIRSKLALMLPLLALAAACGGNGTTGTPAPDASVDAAVDKTAAFVGTWTVTGGMLMGMCMPAPPGLPPSFMQNLDRGEQVIKKGTDADLEIGVLEGCSVKADVADKVATIRPGQSCNIMFMGFPVMGTVNTGNYTLTDTGASFAYTGVASLGNITCPFNASGMSVRGSLGDAGAGG